MLDYQAQDDAIRQFADVLADAGLVLKGLPVMDGRLHHVPTLGAKGKSDNAGVYVGHLDGGVAAGWFNNYRTDPLGEGQKWKAAGFKETRSPVEIQRSREEAEQRRVQEEQRRAKHEDRIARWAERKWNRSEPAKRHPYLERKGVEACGLRIDSQNRLVIPMRDLDGKIWSLQTISADGEKHYTSGGRKKGLHAMVGAYDPAKPLVFAEGFATAASVHQATGHPVAVVFDSGNLKPVAEAYRARNVVQTLIFAADNDHHLPLKQSPSGHELPNVGVEKAEEGARAVNGVIVVPAFERGNLGTDWNDYAAQHGLAAVAKAFGGLSCSAPRVSGAPGIPKPQQIIIHPKRPSPERSLPEEEVSMSKENGAEQPARDSVSNAEPAPVSRVLERLTRADVERALQTGASLAQKDSSGLDLSKLRFEGINLASSNLSSTRNVNTTYEASRLDGINFSDALFRSSTIERVYAVNSRWDRAQFDQTNIVFSNFGNASFRDALFRDMPRTRNREEHARKQSKSEDSPGNSQATQESRQTGRSAWTEAAALAGTFLKDIGKSLKDVSVEVYQKVRDWWTQPLHLSPEIDRNTSAVWTPAPPAYAAYEQPQAETWSAPRGERMPGQTYSGCADMQGRARVNGSRRASDAKRETESGRTQNTEERIDSATPSPSDTTQESARTQPALIARNNFQFADFTGARFESIRVQDNDFRHAVLANAQFPAELRESNKVERNTVATKQSGGIEGSARENAKPLRRAKTDAERQQDRAALAETIKRDIEKRERGLQEGDSGLYRDRDALHLTKEMLRQLEAGAERIDLTTTYKAADEAAAEERHVRAYNSVNPLIAEAYAKGVAVDRGSASLERAQAISNEAARLHEDVNATKNGQDRKDLMAETKSLEAEGVSLRTEGEAKESEIRADLDREAFTPMMSMEQDRFDALLSVGVFDMGKSAEWRKEMDQKISGQFRMLSAEAGNGNDQRTLWYKAAKQVQQGELLAPQQTREAFSLDRGQEINDQSPVLAQKQEVRRPMALAR
jgi:phage/plasmid primase-like uncharacterized protein/uncharacterized protein YjbI with pentapeptide repeats